MSAPALTVDYIKNDGGGVLRGRFAIKNDDELFARDSLHDALVMSVTYNSGYCVTEPYGNMVLFEDDVSRGEDTVAGTFTVNIGGYLQKLGKNKYHVMFSLGRHLSDIFEIET